MVLSLTTLGLERMALLLEWSLLRMRFEIAALIYVSVSRGTLSWILHNCRNLITGKLEG